MGLLSRAALVTPLALMLTALVTAPALASAGPTAADLARPDGWIRFKSYQSPFGTHPYPSPWSGDNVYDTTGQDQTESMRAMGAYERGTRLVFVVAIQNDGAPDRIMVNASGTGSWPVAYFDDRTDVTQAVVNGTYLTERLGTGERAFLKVKVRLGGPGSSVMRRLLLTSLGAPDRQDVVRLKVSYSTCGC